MSSQREHIWLTVHYSPRTRGWFIYTTDPRFMSEAWAKEFTAIEGKDYVYMIQGFEHYEDAKEFAIDYHEAKRDGFVNRLRLD